MRNLFLTFICSIAGSVLFAQEKYMSTVAETEAISAKVVELFKQEKYSKAISEIAPYWPLPEAELTELTDKTVKSMGVATERYGKVVATTKLKSETVADFAVRETYIIRYEFHALRLIFTYYKNDSGWIVNGFKWDDKFVEEFN